MTFDVGTSLCKYIIDGNKLIVREGVVEERSGRCKWVNFGPGVDAEKVPRYRDLGRVWKGGEILWMDERNDGKARDRFIAYHKARVAELEKEIEDVNGVLKLLRYNRFKVNSRCFEDGEASEEPKSAVKSVAKKRDARGAYQKEYYERNFKAGWDCSEFVDIEQYAKRKIDMLEKEMYINLTDDEIAHLKSLGSQSAIDAAVRAIINRAW